MRFTSAALFALCSVSAFASPIESEGTLEIRSLMERARITTQINCASNGQGDTNDSNNNGAFLKGFGQQKIEVPQGVRQIARTRDTKAVLYLSRGDGRASYFVPGDTLGQVVLEVDYVCGQTGRVAGLGYFNYENAQMVMIISAA